METNGNIVLDWNEEETCVDCGKKLGYPKGRHINLRPNYVNGHGDHCTPCLQTCSFAAILGTN